MVIAELQKYEISLPTCKKLIDRIDIEFFDDQVDFLQAGKIKELIVLIPSRHDLDLEDFPNVATSWDEVVKLARDDAINFFSHRNRRNASRKIKRKLLMGAGFLTKDQKAKQRERTIENAAQGVSEFYIELGPDFGRALFFACMRVWASGASTTLMRLNNEVRPHIVNAFKYGEDLAGVLLKKMDLNLRLVT